MLSTEYAQWRVQSAFNTVHFLLWFKVALRNKNLAEKIANNFLKWMYEVTFEVQLCASSMKMFLYTMFVHITEN